MLTTTFLQQKIMRLKKENDICILAHAYQTHDILEIADFVGDSFGLSVQAKDAPQKNILMCGVRFMAETAKILSPDKRVFLSHSMAGCPMAEQMTVEQIRELKRKNPGVPVVAYINTTSELKTECDVCVTSASALKIVKALDSDKVIFIPDCNLGSWVAKQVPEKEFIFIDGGCPVHKQITVDEVVAARKAHPDAQLLVHPECIKQVTDLADYAGSTTGIMAYAKNSDCKEFIIGTDNSIVQHLQYDHPDKKFYPLSVNCVCSNMRATTLADVYACVSGAGGEEIVLPQNVMEGATRCIDAMLAYGG